MKIRLAGILVDNQEKALDFYTKKLGFVKKWDLPIGGGARFLTVASPEEPDGTELLLEPNDNPVLNGSAQTYQKSLYTAGIPLTAFIVENISAEYERMTGLGVVFTTPPTKLGMVTLAVLDDTCGNLIQIFQPMMPGSA
jgi:catechol 2,3-dioxygenase-like lactoylglutathione lyase family enzyme